TATSWAGGDGLSRRGGGVQTNPLLVDELYLALGQDESALARAGAEAIKQLRLALPEQVAGFARRDGASLDGLPDDESAAGLGLALPGGAAVGHPVLANLAVPVGAGSDDGPLGSHILRRDAAEVLDQVAGEGPNV